MRAGGEATRGIVAWLRRAGLASLAAEALEAFTPIATVGAQFSYLAAPFVGGMNDLGRRLEDPAELIRQLRDEAPDP